MIQAETRVHRWAAMLAATLLLGGCIKSSAARFYSLSPMASPGTSPRAASSRTAVVALGPVAVADYLDRPQIVRRTSPARLDFTEEERWAGALDKDVARVLRENLTLLLSPDGIAVVPWTRDLPMRWRVAVDVTRFDILPAQILLRAQWVVFAEEEDRAVVPQESVVQEPVGGPGLETAVSAMNRSLATLSREIAQTLRRKLQAASRPPGASRPAGGEL